PTRYCTFSDTTTMFSSRVSTGTVLVKVRMPVASTFITFSIGHGSFRLGPGCRIRTAWPKRSTTPRWRSAARTNEVSTSQAASAITTQRSGLPPPEPPNRLRARSSRSSKPPPPPRPPPGFQGLRPLPPDPPPRLLLPGMFQGMPAPVWGFRAAGAGDGRAGRTFYKGWIADRKSGGERDGGGGRAVGRGGEERGV